MEGAPNILMTVARGLKALGRIEPVIVAPCDGPARKVLEAENITVRLIKLRDEENILRPWLDLKELKEAVDTCVDFLGAEKPDVVVTNVLNTFFMIEAAHRLALPSIWWLHESYDHALMLRNLYYTAMPMCEGAFIKATRVLFVSKDTAGIYCRYNINLNFSVIHNSLDADLNDVATDDNARKGARKKLGVKENQNVLISVGTICDRKDQGTIVESVRLLAQERDDFICYLVGYRDSLAYATDIAQRIEKFNLGQKVILVPETMDVARYYQAADIFLFSSLNESYSLTILEAMTFGLPIITTKCCGISEQVRFGKNALHFNFRDARGLAANIRTMMDDVPMRKQFGRNSRQVLAYQQSSAEMIERHEELILGAYMHGGIGSGVMHPDAKPMQK
jgi:glycosyltransferase involved in cell wall biosynthesis